jgi:aminoglycoside phosphotransferase (APT) family kinase protein
MLELTIANAAAYLAQRGWVGEGFCQVEELAGGVSNVVFRVKTLKGWFVLKQSRSQLRVNDPWFSDLSRVYREIDAMELLGQSLPEGLIPRVLRRDDENYAYLMSHAPRDAQDWRSVLLQERIDPSLGEAAGRLLGRIHETTRDMPLERFRDTTIFEQLRVEPFYQRVALRRPEVAPSLQPLIDDVLNQRVCLCHGDYSPKNLLWHGDAFTLVDFETCHWGDPAFDLGFFLSHLFLKAIHLPRRFAEFRWLMAGFWRGYQDTSWFKPFEPLLAGAIAHLGACLLARVDGASPAPYLAEREKEPTRRLAILILREHLVDWDETIEALRTTAEPLIA